RTPRRGWVLRLRRSSGRACRPSLIPPFRGGSTVARVGVAVRVWCPAGRFLPVGGNHFGFDVPGVAVLVGGVDDVSGASGEEDFPLVFSFAGQGHDVHRLVPFGDPHHELDGFVVERGGGAHRGGHEGLLFEVS